MDAVGFWVEVVWRLINYYQLIAAHLIFFRLFLAFTANRLCCDQSATVFVCHFGMQLKKVTKRRYECNETTFQFDFLLSKRYKKDEFNFLQLLIIQSCTIPPTQCTSRKKCKIPEHIRHNFVVAITYIKRYVFFQNLDALHGCEFNKSSQCSVRCQPTGCMRSYSAFSRMNRFHQNNTFHVNSVRFKVIVSGKVTPRWIKIIVNETLNNQNLLL